ncbi:hypothetical protein FKP32DRAFT_1594272 [Trametes sanguinea]|nr:hypothetical protein FKP32DRAFT_1594272 [Trametes sanguinea]
MPSKQNVLDGLQTPCSDDVTVFTALEDYSPDTLSIPCIGSKSVAKGIDNHIHSATSAPPPVPLPIIIPPHVVVLYNNQTNVPTAWGREAIARLGYFGFAKAVFDAYILHPSDSPRWSFSLLDKSEYSLFWDAYHFLREDFTTRAKFIPQFAIMGGELLNHGGSPDNLVMQPLGWEEMVRNVLSVRVVYTLPQDFPGKSQLQKRFPRLA